MCPLFLKLSSILKVLILTAKKILKYTVGHILKNEFFCLGVRAVKKNECFLVTFEAGFIRQLYKPTLYRTRDLGIVSCT